MDKLKDVCNFVDDFVKEGTSSKFESSDDFWKKLSKDSALTQMYAECLIYKYIALSYGLGHQPLYTVLSQIKNITEPVNLRKTVACGSPTPTPSASPRGSLTNSAGSGKGKRGSGSKNGSSSDSKSTPKRKINLSRRKSDDKKMNKKASSLDVPSDVAGRRKSSKNMTKTQSLPEALEEAANACEDKLQNDLENILFSLSYMTRMCDLTKWDFTKLRDVFLTWNKARGWEQNASDYEYSVMKNFSKSPQNAPDIGRAIGDVLLSVSKETAELGIGNPRHVGDSIRFWELRHKVLKRPEEAISVINCLIAISKKVFEDGDESKVLPLLHIFCETVIVCPHTPLELLQEAYSTFAKFYVWPLPVAQAVKEVLDMIQFEMKCPGHFFRMIFFQDNDISLPQHLTSRMPPQETHVFIDGELPDSVALEDAFTKLQDLNKTDTKLGTELKTWQYVISQIFESVFGSECCDLETLDQALQACPDEKVPNFCFEALELLEKASTMESHEEAQNFLRKELETFSEKIVDFLEDNKGKDSSTDQTSPSLAPRQPSARRVSVLIEPIRSLPASGHLSPNRNESYLRRASSGNIDNQKKDKKVMSRFSRLRRLLPAELIGTKVKIEKFAHNDLSETIFQLVRNTAKKYVQEKKERGRLNSSNRKRNSSHFDAQVAFRDSGVIEDEYSNSPNDPTSGNSSRLSSTSAQYMSLSSAVQNLQLGETPEIRVKMRRKVNDNQKESDNTTSATSTCSSTDDPEDSESSRSAENDFWKQFKENGFNSEESLEIEELVKSMTISERKSFISGKNSNKPNETPGQENQTGEEQISPAGEGETTPCSPRESEENSESGEFKEKILRSEKRLNRISQFGMKGIKLVRQRRRSSKKRESMNKDRKSSIESLSSVSSHNSSSSTSEEPNDFPVPRYRTSSDPIYRHKKRGKWTSGITPTSSPLASKTQRHRLSVDVTPRSTFNLSVRSLPGRERKSLFGAEYTQTRIGFTLSETDVSEEILPSELMSPKDDIKEDRTGDNQSLGPKKIFTFSSGEEGDGRIRMDSGIGVEYTRETSRRRSLPHSYKIQQDLSVAGVKFTRKDALRKQRLSRLLSSSDADVRTVQKKTIKLVFVGNDKTAGHLARAYYDLRRRQTSRAPLFQHVDLRMYFIPTSTPEKNDLLPVDTLCGPCDVRLGEMLGAFDSWYHTVVMLSVNNLIRVFPKMWSSSGVATDEDNLDHGIESRLNSDILTPQTMITSSLLSYTRYAVSKTDVTMYKVVMTTSTGDIITDIFCCRLQVGHDAYIAAAKAGHFGKLGKLVDLTDDSGPPAAYSKIEYSQLSIDGMLIYSGKLDDTFYHTVDLTPMYLVKPQYAGRDTLHLFVIDNERKSKLQRRNRFPTLECMEAHGKTLGIGTMKMEVVRPSQGTFALQLDNSKIYTSIKSIEIMTCPKPEMEMMPPNEIIPRSLQDHYLLKLPIHTYWPGAH